MKSGGRCSYSAAALGIDGLITLSVGVDIRPGAFDVGRQRRFTELIDKRIQITCRLKLDDNLAFRGAVNHACRQLIGKLNQLIWLQAFCRPSEDFPNSVSDLFN